MDTLGQTESGTPRVAATAGKGERYPPWLWLNLLSLDAPLVAVVWQCLFARSIGVSMPWTVHLLLGVAVWVIYVSDRLIDAARLDESKPATARHLFYRRHWKVFLGSVSLAAVCGSVAILFTLPEALVARGLFLVMLVGVYFLYVALMRHYRRVLVPKEVACGIIFAIGTNLGPAFYLSNQEAGGFQSVTSLLLEGVLGFGEAARSLPVFVFMGLCCLNCAIIAVWERGADEGQDAAALTHAGRALDVPFSWSILLLAAVSFAMLVREWGDGDAAVYASVILSAMGLLVLERNAERLSRPALRTLADVVLLSPLLVAPLLG